MSTKIYNGYKLPPLTHVALIEALRNFNYLITKQAKKEYRKLFGDIASNVIDSYSLGYKLYLNNKSYNTNTSSIVDNYLNNKRKEIKNTGLRDPEFDFECSLVIIPKEDKHLACLFTERKSFTKIWEELPIVREYGYWNNSDKLETVSEKAWEQRKVDWEPYCDGPLCEFGYTYQCALDYSIFCISAKDVIIPTFKNRVNKQVNKITQDYYCKIYCDKNNIKINLNNYYDFVSSYKNWIKKDGLKYINNKRDEISQILKKKIVKEDLLSPLELANKQGDKVFNIDLL